MHLASEISKRERAVVRKGAVVALATALVYLSLTAPVASAHDVRHDHSADQPLPQWLTYVVFLGGPALPILAGGVLLARELRRPPPRHGDRNTPTPRLTERTT